MTAALAALIHPPGWTFVGTFADPPDPPPGFYVETKDDGFLGIVTHYRFVPRGETKMDTAPVQAANDNVDFGALATTIHADNVVAGWWTDMRTGESLLHTRNRPEMLMLAVSELAEAAEGLDGGLMDDKLPHRKMFDVELADFAIRQFDQIGAEVAAGRAVMPRFDRDRRASENFLTQGEQLLLLVRNTAAAMEYYRKGRVQDYVDTMGQGIALVFALAAWNDIPLMQIIDEKRAFNASREDHKLANRLAAGGKAF